MQIELSKEAIGIILTELDTARTRCGWELSKLPLYKTDSAEYAYWTQRQGTIEKVLKELHKFA
jgi:hypothetical protein